MYGRKFYTDRKQIWKNELPAFSEHEINTSITI
jgi:hypothetical protein